MTTIDDYKYIRAYGMLEDYTEDRIKALQADALVDNAPIDACYREWEFSSDGELFVIWVALCEIQNLTLRIALQYIVDINSAIEQSK